MGRLIVRCCNCPLVERHGACEGSGACFIHVPSVELVSSTFSFRCRDFSTVGNTEVHVLRIRAPVKRRIRPSVRVQEDTVLDLAPFGIDRQTAFRHRCKCILVRTGRIDVPAFKDIPSGRRRRIEIGSVFVIGTQICAVGDIADLMQLSAACFIQRVVVAVHISTVHEIQLKMLACVVQADGPVAVKVGPAIFIRRIRTEFRVAGDIREFFALR